MEACSFIIAVWYAFNASSFCREAYLEKKLQQNVAVLYLACRGRTASASGYGPAESGGRPDAACGEAADAGGNEGKRGDTDCRRRTAAESGKVFLLRREGIIFLPQRGTSHPL